MKKVWFHLEENHVSFLLTLLIGLLFSAISVIAPTISGNLVTAVITNVSDSSYLLLLFLAISILQIIFSQLDLYASNTLNRKQKLLMRNKAFRSFSANENAKREDISTFVSFINNDIPSIVEQFFLGTIDIIKCISIILFSAVSLVSIHWLFALIIVGISFLIVFLPKTMKKQSGIAREGYSDSLAEYNTILQSFLGGLKILKTYNYNKRADELLKERNDFVAKKESTLLKHQLLIQGITTFLQIFKTLLILIVGIGFIANGRIEIGNLITILQLNNVISAPIEVLAYLYHSRNQVLPLLNKYETLIKENPETTPAKELENDCIQELSVQNLSYRIDQLEILKNISVKFFAGEKYLITGESGSGKSTLLRLLARIAEQDYSGSIFLNHEEIRSLECKSYFEKICPVFQEPYLFHATLRENILLGREIASSVYMDVIDKLHLSYLLERYENQEITPEIINLLSGGEKQRIALARAMVGKPQIYLLDEVTSSLDPQNASHIEELLLHEDAMVIHISHKANKELQNQYSKKYVLKDGSLHVL